MKSVPNERERAAGLRGSDGAGRLGPAAARALSLSRRAQSGCLRLSRYSRYLERLPACLNSIARFPERYGRRLRAALDAPELLEELGPLPDAVAERGQLLL